MFLERHYRMWSLPGLHIDSAFTRNIHSNAVLHNVLNEQYIKLDITSYATCIHPIPPAYVDIDCSSYLIHITWSIL